MKIPTIPTATNSTATVMLQMLGDKMNSHKEQYFPWKRSLKSKMPQTIQEQHHPQRLQELSGDMEDNSRGQL